MHGCISRNNKPLILGKVPGMRWKSGWDERTFSSWANRKHICSNLRMIEKIDTLF